MMRTLTESLLNGFAMITDKLVDKISDRIALPDRCAEFQSMPSNKRRRDDTDNNDTEILMTSKRFIFGTNDKNGSIAVTNKPQDIAHSSSSSSDNKRRKSVVVSNIGKNITSDHIIDYLADELNLDKDIIRVTPLAPAGKNMDDLAYLQYRVSTPASMYPSLISASTWPKGVRVRDFIFNKRADTASLDNFLVRKAAHTPLEIGTPSVVQSITVTENVPASTESIVMDHSNSSTTTQ